MFLNVSFSNFGCKIAVKALMDPIVKLTLKASSTIKNKSYESSIFSSILSKNIIFFIIIGLPKTIELEAELIAKECKIVKKKAFKS